MTISEKIIQRKGLPTLVNKLTDWQNFKYSLEKKINLLAPVINEEQLEEEVHKFVHDIQQAAWENTPELKTTIKGNYYPAEIRKLLAEKRKSRKVWQQTRAPIDKKRFNNLTQKLRRTIKELKNKSLDCYLKTLTNTRNTNYSLWRATKRLKRPIMHIPPIRNANGKWIKNNEDKAKLFAEHLENIFQPNENNSNKTFDMLIQKECQVSEKIRLTSLKEVTKEIKDNFKLKKTPGYDLITGEILRNLPKIALIKITILINSAFRIQYVPSLWKIAEVIMLPKPGKPPHDVTSYRPISLLPVMSKLFEKLLIKRLNLIIKRKNLIPNHQFGFRNKHSTIDQVHRITNIIEKALEEKQVCSAIFLDVAQAFDKVWHEGLKHKLKNLLPSQFAKILESYLDDRLFMIRLEDAYSEMKVIKAGVPQGSVLGPVLYLLYTNDLPSLGNNTVATFADDTAILAVGKSNAESTVKLQSSIAQIENWTDNWRIKLNKNKSVHVDFTNKRIDYIPITISQQKVPYANTAKYLGMTLDAKLRWKAHVKTKRDEAEIKYRQLHWLIGRKSLLSTHNKLLLYKQILKPIWSYGIQLWGCTKDSNIAIIQRFQNKVLRNITNAPWYIRNIDLHKDLHVEQVSEEIKKSARRHKERLESHVNIEAARLLDSTNTPRRLQRKKPLELV